MKTLLLILTIISTPGCYASGYHRHYGYSYYPYSQYNGSESIGHWRRENQLRAQIFRQQEQMEEIRLQNQLRYNEDYIQREQIRLQNNWR